MFDVRTPDLDLPLPDPRNPLKFDVERLIQSLTKIDEVMSGFGGILNGMTGVMVDYSLSTLPDDSWRFCDGQPLLVIDAKAARLRAKLIAEGSPYGDDGFGNPLLPDYRGRVGAGKDDMGGTASNRLTSIAGGTLGATGGAETHALTTDELAKHGHAVNDTGHNHSVIDPGHAHAVYDPGHSHGFWISGGISNGDFVYPSESRYSTHRTAPTTASGTGIGIYAAATGLTLSSSTSSVSVEASGEGQAHNNMQPTLVVNKIIKL